MKGWKKPGRPKAVPFSMHTLKKIQSTMEEIIMDDSLQYANYGSFFSSWNARESSCGQKVVYSEEINLP